MSNVYDEESQIEDLNVEADRVIAMNPSGVIENFMGDVNNKKIHCDGDKCVILGDDEIENCVNGFCETKSTQTSYSKYIMYFVIFLAICALAYFLYKKYYCSS